MENEFQRLAKDLRQTENVAAASIVETLGPPAQSMRVTHTAQAAYGGQAWNGWIFVRVMEELKKQKVSPKDGLAVFNAIRLLEEDERLNCP